MKKIVFKILPIFFACLFCTGAGYKGILPDINSAFEHLRDTPQKTQGLFSDNEQNSSAKMKNAPKENKAYIDIILKKDRTSPYTNDLNEAIGLLEKMDKCIKSGGNTQKFNAIASSIIDHASFMSEKYSDKPERHYISFAKLQTIAQQAGEVATLRCESQMFAKYLPQEGEGKTYGQANLDTQVAKFQTELESAILIMKDSR